jgi:hypothetical protein
MTLIFQKDNQTAPVTQVKNSFAIKRLIQYKAPKKWDKDERLGNPFVGSSICPLYRWQAPQWL